MRVVDKINTNDNEERRRKKWMTGLNNFKPQAINLKLFLSFQMNGKHNHAGLNGFQYTAVVEVYIAVVQVA